MKYFILISALVALSCAQYQEGPSQIIGVPGPRWQGPTANHIPGQLVGDTPEVAAAKAAHFKAHADALAILPPLAPEQRYQQTGINFVPTPAPAPVYHNLGYQNIHNTAEPVHTSPQFTQFAEEIPRSEIGEVPEVAAARRAHLAAYEEIKKLLPKLDTTNVRSHVVNPAPVVQPWQYNQQYNTGLPTDAPDVAAAKLEFMRLYQAALG